MSYKEAVESINEATKWKAAMNEEIKSLHQNEVWELVEAPKG